MDNISPWIALYYLNDRYSDNIILLSIKLRIKNSSDIYLMIEISKNA